MAVNALNLAKKQYSSGTIKKDNKKKLIDLTKQNIDASGGDREAGLTETRKQLAGATAPSSTPTGTNLPTTSGQDISGAGVKGYDESQVGIPGVNMVAEPTKKDGVFNKPDAFGSKTDTAPVPDNLDPQGTGTGGTTGDTGAGQDYKSFDTNKDGIINENELSGDYKKFYDGLSENEKKLFLATGENAMKNNLDIAESYANYMRDYKTTKTRAEENEAYRLKQQGISEEMAQIQESQTFRRAKDGIAKLRQSVAYMGDLGMPGKSAQRMVSVENQLEEASQSFQEIQSLLGKSKAARALGFTQKAVQYERQMEDITTKLNDDIDSSIQDAFNGLTEADSNGKLDTVEELTAFRDKMYQDLDASITGFSDASMEQMRFLSGEVNKARNEAIAYEQNSNTVNGEMSSVKGYYVNGNGSPIYDSNGSTIKIPKALPEGFEPFQANGKFFSPKIGPDGELVLDENGNPQFNSTILEDEVSVTAQLANSYINAVNSGAMSAEDAIKAVPSLASNEAFIGGIQGEEEGKTTDKWSKLNDNTLYNQATGESKDIRTGQITSDFTDNPDSIADYSMNRRGRVNLQCGELVNDYLFQATGINPTGQSRFTDTLESKVDAVTSLGMSEIPVAGGLFVSNPLGNDVGHTGIIQTVNPDGSIEVLEANADGKSTGQRPVLKKYTAEEAEAQGMVYSNAPKGEEQKEEDITIAKNYSTEAQSWAKNILDGKADAKITGIKDEKLRNEVSNYLANVPVVYNANHPVMTDLSAKISALDKIVDWSDEQVKGTGLFEDDSANEKTIESFSGARRARGISPYQTITGKRSQLLGKIQYLLDAEVLQNLIDVKSRGATFGALSEKELAILQASAGELNSSAERNDEGKIIGFDKDEEEVKQELQKMMESFQSLKNSFSGKETSNNVTAKSSDEDILSYLGGGSDITKTSSDDDILNYLNK